MDLTTCFNVSFVAQWEWIDPFSNQGGDDSGIRDVVREEPHEARVGATVLDHGRLKHRIQSLGALVDCQTFESFMVEMLSFERVRIKKKLPWFAAHPVAGSDSEVKSSAPEESLGEQH
jgi:hypothetical protein